MKGLPFTFEKGAAWYVMDQAKENRKINADGKGWLAFCDNGLMFIKKFEDIKAAEAAREAGLGLNAGHDLSLENLTFLKQQIPWMDEVSIGHALVCDALYLGLQTTIEKYKECLR